MKTIPITKMQKIALTAAVLAVKTGGYCPAGGGGLRSA